MFATTIFVGILPARHDMSEGLGGSKKEKPYNEESQFQGLEILE